MAELNFNSGILNIKVNKYGDSIAIDSSDLSVFEKFSALIKKSEEHAENADRSLHVIQEKHKDETKISADMLMDYVGINVEYSKNIMKELNDIFGSDFTDKVYRENYEHNPYFVPDEMSLAELIEAIVPLMEDAYGERIKRNKSKYNANNRGKHTKTKDELIAEYKEKVSHE